MTRALDPVWDAIQAALDARRDPLDDPSVASFLSDRPEAAREYAELALGLERIGPGRIGLGAGESVRAASAPGKRARPPRVLLAAVAAVIVTLGALAFFLPRSGRREEAGLANARRENAPGSVDAAREAAVTERTYGVTHYRIEREFVTPTARERVVVEDGRVARATSTTSAGEVLAVTIERTTWSARAPEFR